MKNNVTAILCARMSSTRLPGKVLADICGKPALEHIVERLNKAECIGKVIIATSTHDDDDAIASLAAGLSTPCYRGSLNNVSERIDGAIKRHAPDSKYIFRAMSDQPFFDWKMLDEAFSLLVSHDWDFLLPLSFDADPVYGAGQTPWSTIAWHWDVAMSKNEEKEHPGMCIRRNLNRFEYGLLELPKWVWRGHRLELDTHEDLTLFRLIYNAWDGEGPPPLRWVVSYLDRNRQISAINAGVIEKTGTYTSYTADEIQKWNRDYVGREIVWSDFSYWLARLQKENTKYNCKKCGGVLIGPFIKKGNLVLKCAKCNDRRTFYAKKE